MGEIIKKFTFERNALKRNDSISAAAVAKIIDDVISGASFEEKAGSNIRGALSSYIGVLKKEDNGFVETKLSRVYRRLDDENGLDAWRWLLTRALWKYVVPNGTNASVNKISSISNNNQFCFFRNFLVALVLAQGEKGDKRFIYYDELFEVLDNDDMWFKSGQEIWLEINKNRNKSEFNNPANRGSALEVEMVYSVPKDNLASFFNKTLSQTGLVEYKKNKKSSSVGVALAYNLDSVLQERVRHVIDNPQSWVKEESWPDYLAWHANDFPEKVTLSSSVVVQKDGFYKIPSEYRKDSLLDKPVQLLVHGAPGTGKSYEIERYAESATKVLRVVFFPETTYSDFVGVYRPRPIYRDDDETFVDESGGVRIHGEPFITYEFVPGPLIRAYCFAKKNPSEPVVLMIEEMSRGNASAIFGDMLQLLDRNSDGESVYEVTPRSEIRSYLIKNGIGVDLGGVLRFPNNLYLWGTMNRADQNARQLDSAFLRRWMKLYKSYDVSCSYGDLKVDVPGSIPVEWDVLRKKINDVLVNHVAEDKLIGPYFLPPTVLLDRAQVAEDLLGYLWNDVLKKRHSVLFTTRTFSEAMLLWREGSESPFKDIIFK